MHSSKQQSFKIDYSGRSVEVIRSGMEREGSEFEIHLHYSQVNPVRSKESIYNH